MNKTDVPVMVAEILLRIGAVSLRPERPFVYSSGTISPIYCDNRLLMSHPAERRVITRLLCDRIIADLGPSAIDVVAATAMAGIPFAAWIVEVLDKPMVYVRPMEKLHGKRQRIEGAVRNNQRAVVIEDLITTASSAISTAEALRESGVSVEHCFSIFTYEMVEASWRLQTADLQLHPLCGFSAAIRRALESEKITHHEYGLLLDWKEAQDANFRSSGLA